MIVLEIGTDRKTFPDSEEAIHWAMHEMMKQIEEVPRLDTEDMENVQQLVAYFNQQYIEGLIDLWNEMEMGDAFRMHYTVTSNVCFKPVTDSDISSFLSRIEKHYG